MRGRAGSLYFSEVGTSSSRVVKILRQRRRPSVAGAHKITPSCHLSGRASFALANQLEGRCPYLLANLFSCIVNPLVPISHSLPPGLPFPLYQKGPGQGPGFQRVKSRPSPKAMCHMPGLVTAMHLQSRFKVALSTAFRRDALKSQQPSDRIASRLVGVVEVVGKKCQVNAGRRRERKGEGLNGNSVKA